jgi:hypothetical protein
MNVWLVLLVTRQEACTTLDLKPEHNKTNDMLKREKLIEQKIYRRRKRKRLSKKEFLSGHVEVHFKDVVLERHLPNLINFLREKGFVDKAYSSRIIDVPTNLSFDSNYAGCILLFKRIISSSLLGGLKIYIDFTNCESISVTCVVMVKIFIAELKRFLTDHNRNRYKKVYKELIIIQSKYGTTNQYLRAMELADADIEKTDVSEYLPLGYTIRGRMRNYKENTKSRASIQVAEFIEQTTRKFNMGFSQQGRHYIGSMMGEILSNAEDHSEKCSEWFVDGVSLLKSNEEIIEFNLVILNYGDSMYEGFEKTKKENQENYRCLLEKYDVHKNLFSYENEFSRESLFVLYMLNEGISRLKYKDSSRGNGTMRFIKAFMDLGKSCNSDPKYNPKMNLISGHTILTCDEKYAPFSRGTHRCLSLNKEDSLDLLPDKSNLRNFSDAFFPGTILECQIFLNRNDLENKMSAKES